MKPFARKILLFVCALVLLSGSVAARAAVPACAGTPVAHQHQGHAGHHHQGKSERSACLTCCLVACVATPGVPLPALFGREPSTIARVDYWPDGRTLVGRPTPPDALPPRPNA